MKRFTMLAKAIAVMAVAGAALAFTPKKGDRLCIDSDNNGLCDNFFEGTIVPDGGTERDYVVNFIPTVPAQCNDLQCTSTSPIRVVVGE